MAHFTVFVWPTQKSGINIHNIIIISHNISGVSPAPHRPPKVPYHCVDSGIKAERCVFGREGFAGGRHQVWVSCAGSALCDVVQRRMAAQSRVVWPAGRQEVRRLVSCHHLTCIGKDGGGEEAEGVDTYVKKEKRDKVRKRKKCVYVNSK